LDFEILRFFRKAFNNSVDFDESPRDLFDSEYMLSLRMRLLGRNFKVIILKFIFMTIFSFGSLLLSKEPLWILGFLYVAVFLYHIAVPIGFVKYTRQYIMDDNSETGKLKKFHNTYKRWLRPLEVIAMNFFTILFILVEIGLYLKLEVVYSYIQTMAVEHIHVVKLLDYIQSVSYTDMQHSIYFVIFFYLSAYIIYWLYIYKYYAPKWEEKRIENYEKYIASSNRTAQNLQNEFSTN
jgi:hypothetical protein